MNKFYSTVLVAAAALFAPAVADAATPADVTITVDNANGKWWRFAGNQLSHPTAPKNYVYQWTSTAEAPQLTMRSWNFSNGVLAENPNQKTNQACTAEIGFILFGNGTQGTGYKFTTSEGYYISHISVDVTKKDATTVPTDVASAVPCNITIGTASGTTGDTPLHLESDFTPESPVVIRVATTTGNIPVHVTNCQVTISPITTATITYEWKTENGAHLTAPVTVQTTGNQAYTVNQEAKTFDHFTLVNASPLQGTSITPAPNTNTKITSIYHNESNVIPGVKSLAYSVSTIEAGKTYALFSQHSTNTNRDAFRYVRDDNKIYGKGVANLTDETPYFTWVIESAETEGQYKFKNNGNDWYIAELAHNTQASVSQTAGTFIIVPHTSDPTKFKISSATDNTISWDGNGAEQNYLMNGWRGDGNKITPYEYVIDPYFSVTVQHVRYDSNGNGSDENVVISSTKHLVKAGSDFTLPEIPATVSGEGYTNNEFKYSEGADDLTNIQGHKVVKHFYDVRTGVESISNDSKAAVIFDLMGRKLDNASKPGIYVINGKKVVIK